MKKQNKTKQNTQTCKDCKFLCVSKEKERKGYEK